MFNFNSLEASNVQLVLNLCFFSIRSGASLTAKRELSFQDHSNLPFDNTCKYVEVLPLEGFQIAIAKIVEIICFYVLATSEAPSAMNRTVSARECHCSGFVLFEDAGRCSVTSSANTLTRSIRSSGKSCVLPVLFAYMESSSILEGFRFVCLFFCLNLNQSGCNLAISFSYCLHIQKPRLSDVLVDLCRRTLIFCLMLAI